MKVNLSKLKYYSQKDIAECEQLLGEIPLYLVFKIDNYEDYIINGCTANKFLSLDKEGNVSFVNINEATLFYATQAENVMGQLGGFEEFGLIDYEVFYYEKLDN